MNDWIEDYIERHRKVFPSLTLHQILFGLRLVLENKDFDLCDKFISECTKNEEAYEDNRMRGQPGD